MSRSTRLGSATANAPARMAPEDSPNISTEALPVTFSTTGRAAFRSSTPVWMPELPAVREEKP